MQALKNTAIAKIYEDDESEETECAPTKVGSLASASANASVSRVSFPSSAESSEVLDAFRAWSDAASRTRKTESGIQLLGAPASPPPPKPETRKFELLRAEITHTTTSLTPLPAPPPSRAPTFDLLALAARGTRSLPRPELPSAILKRSDLVLDPLPVVYDDDEDDWAETLRYRRPSDDAPAEAEESEVPERRSSVPPPPASRSFTLLPPSPRQRIKAPPPFRSIRGGAAPRPEPRRATTESGIVAKVSSSEIAPLGDLPPLLRSTVRKAFTRPISSVTTTRVVFGPPRLPTPLRVELTKLPVATPVAPSAAPAPPALVPTPRITVPVLDALAKGPTAEPSRTTNLREVVSPRAPAVAAPKPASPRVALAIAKAEKAREKLHPRIVRPPVVVTPPPRAEATPARAAEVERDPFRASTPPQRAPSARAHIHFVLAVAFVFACVAILLWLGAPFWRHLLAGLL